MTTSPVDPAMRYPSDFATAPFSLPSGARVLGRFTIQRGLGIGGFGEVYFALSDAGKEVALKRIQRNLEIELRGVSHCLNLKHPNLISLFDVCQDDAGQWWVVMEYVAGPSLRDCLETAPQGLGESESRRWFAAVAAGVDHLHQQGLVHRDLKPGNLFDDSGQIKVGDYGLSKYISDSKRGRQTESVGTFHYMAPEVGRGEYGCEIDIYALGVILFEMLTGRLPFEGETCQEIVIKHLCSQPDLSGIAEPFRSVIDKALRKDPRTRWATAAEMSRALGGNPFTAAAFPTSPASSAATQRSPQSVATTHDAPVHATLVGRPASPLWWQQMLATPLTQFLIAALVLAVLLRSGGLLALPLLVTILFICVPYYLLRQLFAAPPPRPQQPVQGLIPHAVAARNPPPHRAVRTSRAAWRQLKRRQLAFKPASARLAELAGSFLAAAITAVFCGAAAAVVGLRHADAQAILVAPYAWATVVAFAASVAILALGKCWEGRDGDPLNRRLALAATGLLTGAVAFATAKYLMLPLEGTVSRAIEATALPRSLYPPGGPPGATALMVHFAILAAAVRWWKLTDPLRPRRLSLWAVAVVVVADWLIQQFVPIPQPWGMLIAGVTVIGVQIAAAWESAENRSLTPSLGSGELA